MRIPATLLCTLSLTAACATSGGESVFVPLQAAPGSRSLQATAQAPDPPPKLPEIVGPRIGNPQREPIYLHDYYEVEGNTLDELLQSMEERRPFDHNAYTTWHVGWKYEFVSRPSECELASFWTIVQVRHTLPRLVPDPGQSPALLEEWQRYVAALRVHEEQHAAFGHQAAVAMERLVAQRFTHGASRQRLSKGIDEACRDVLRDMREREKTYDKLTDHGRTQGAWLAQSSRPRSAPAASAR